MARSGRPWARLHPVVGHDTNERYRRLVELSPDGIFVDRESRIVFVNPAAMRLFGATSAEQILGRSPFELFHPEDHALIRERIGSVLAGKTAPLVEHRIVRLDGSVVDVEVTGALLEDGDARAIQVIVRDVTERKRTEAALRVPSSSSRLSSAWIGRSSGCANWE